VLFPQVNRGASSRCTFPRDIEMPKSVVVASTGTLMVFVRH
jgi:hypothetical protein